MRPFILKSLVPILCLLVLPVHAVHGQTAPENTPDRADRPVVVEVERSFNDTTQTTHLPRHLMELLMDEKHVRNFTIKSSDAFVEVMAELEFDSLRSFRKWYGTQAGEGFFTELSKNEGLAHQGELTLKVATH